MKSHFPKFMGWTNKGFGEWKATTSLPNRPFIRCHANLNPPQILWKILGARVVESRAVPCKFWKGIRWPLIYIEVFSLDFIMLFTSKLNVTSPHQPFILCVPDYGIYLAWRIGQNVWTHCPLQQHMRLSTRKSTPAPTRRSCLNWSVGADVINGVPKRDVAPLCVLARIMVDSIHY